MVPKITKHLGIIAKHLVIIAKHLGIGIIPEDWKSANATAIHKKGSRQEHGNNRPISVTSVVFKSMERLVKGRLITHLEMNNQISVSQHGFRNKRSCLTSLLYFYAQVIDTCDTSNNKAVDLVYLDFQKGFDKVPHERLMLKVNQCTWHSR